MWREFILLINVQTCIAAIMAQLGCYVPAESLRMSIVGMSWSEGRGGGREGRVLIGWLGILSTEIDSFMH